MSSKPQRRLSPLSAVWLRPYQSRLSRFGKICGVMSIVGCWIVSGTGFAADESASGQVDWQPLKAQVQRVVSALDYLGEPLSPEMSNDLKAVMSRSEPSVAELQQLLDQQVLATVEINPESRVKVTRGSRPAVLVENGWSVFLVKVINQAGITPQLRVESPHARPVYRGSTGSPEPKQSVLPSEVPDRWLDVSMFDDRPLVPQLSGLGIEYRIVQIYSRDRGQREALLVFDIGQGTQDLGFRNELPVLFTIRPATELELEIYDERGEPTTGQLVIRDRLGRVYPARSRRLAPDFFFHDQIYRHHGESIHLPAGDYEVTYSRGPEYQIEKRLLRVEDQPKQTERFDLHRWIHLADLHWYSGDHHVHAAGCAHYEAPTQGVTPEVMMRHILGEDLNVGCVLSWGPCWYFQKQYFEGDVHKLSTTDNLMRYDVEVSGFPSSHAGHLCLLRLKEDDYPGTTRIEEWPSWDLPVLKWGKEQGGVVGFSHSGWGLEIPETWDLPSQAMPKFDGIGANEYVVDVVHDACDFISAVDTPAHWELNVWYHTLNCGLQCRISGETDFPCIYGERVGLGRAYVKLDQGGPLNFDRWVDGLRDGRSYCCDGLSHLPNFRVNDLGVGEPGEGGRPSVLVAKKGQRLTVKTQAAALLEQEPREDIRRKPLADKPYWHVERARVGDTRKVPVELVVNGRSVERREIPADGTLQDLEFTVDVEQSSWIALRIFPSCHTNPIFVEVDGQPVRASRASAEWCRRAVDVCWEAKRDQIRPAERGDAEAAYDVARKYYDDAIKASP
ncbi:MAG: CehA/McbA family metallohydrolase [Pirellulales bacterium]